ncbi:MAG TPA: OmpA family protein [Planctomycetota bacterium]|nr:OmpA family protein [Planctomycetota bacterium]
MQFRSIMTVLFLLPVLGSCTSRYQDLLRDRDTQIRELNGRIATLRAQNEDLVREGAGAQNADSKKSGDAPTPKENSDAARLQSELPGTEVSYRRGRLSIGVEDEVTFDSGSTALKDSAHKVLSKVVAALKREFPNKRYYIEGHTDSDPIVKTKDKFSSNRHLSVMRADAVAHYLIDQGIPEKQVVVVGFGQFDPKDQKNKAKNRRVEIVVGDGM